MPAGMSTVAHGAVHAPSHWLSARSLYNNIKTPGQLAPSATFLLFKEGIEPVWEDPKNAQGGCWTASLNKGPNAKAQIDAWWLNSVSGTGDARRATPAASLPGGGIQRGSVQLGSGWESGPARRPGGGWRA